MTWIFFCINGLKKRRYNLSEYFLCLYNLIESLTPLCFFYKSKRWHILAVMWNTERVLNEWGDKLSRQLGSTITSSSLQSLSCTCTDWPVRLVDILCSRLHLRLRFQGCWKLFSKYNPLILGDISHSKVLFIDRCKMQMAKLLS